MVAWPCPQGLHVEADACEDGGRHRVAGDARLEAYGRLHGCMLGAQPTWTDDVDPAQVLTRVPGPYQSPCPVQSPKAVDRDRSLLGTGRRTRGWGERKVGDAQQEKQAKGNLRGGQLKRGVAKYTSGEKSERLGRPSRCGDRRASPRGGQDEERTDPPGRRQRTAWGRKTLRDGRRAKGTGARRALYTRQQQQ